MDPNNQWSNGSRLVAKRPTPTSEQAAITNFLMAQQDAAARRNSLDIARRQSLGLSAVPPVQQQAIQDRILFEAIMAAGRASQPDFQSILDQSILDQQQVTSIQLADHQDKPLVIPPQNETLPSMEHMQLDGILEPHPHDVLCGRGGGINHHLGNEKFRQLVQSFKVKYLQCNNAGKTQLSEDVVRAVRAQNPPGRFLQRNEVAGEWSDIGDSRARDKAAQALREGAPDIRQNLKYPSNKRKQNKRLLPLCSRQPVTAEQEMSDAFLAPLPTTNPLVAARPTSASTLPSGRNLLVAPPPPRKPSVDDDAMTSLTRAVSLTSSGHSPSSLSPQGILPAEQLAAEIMSAHVERQAKAAQMVAAARAAAAASLPMGMGNPTKVCLSNVHCYFQQLGYSHYSFIHDCES